MTNELKSPVCEKPNCLFCKFIRERIQKLERQIGDEMMRFAH